MTAAWVFWHRLRGHFIEPNGWLCHGGRATRIWRCVLPCGSERAGNAPGWFRWREQG